MIFKIVAAKRNTVCDSCHLLFHEGESKLVVKIGNGASKGYHVREFAETYKEVILTLVDELS